MDHEIRELAEDKLRLLSRQFEMVLRTTRDEGQRKRVSIQLGRIKKRMAALENGEMSEDEARALLSGKLTSGHEQAEETDGDYGERNEDKERFPFLAKLSIKHSSDAAGGSEVSAIQAYLQHFENEYMPALEAHKLKLDFSYTQRRDTYFHAFNTIQLAMKSYLKDLEDRPDVSNSRGMQGEQAGRMRQMQRKMLIDLMLKCGEFAGGLSGFLDNLLQDHQAGGNLILNPDDTIAFDPIHGERELSGLSVVASVERISLFLSEFAEYLDIPSY